ADQEEIMTLLGGKSAKEGYIHEAMVNPQFGVLSGGGPRLTDSNGVPWQGSYVNANSDPTVDLRSNIAAESRAKIVYEYLMKFTDDPSVKDTLMFLMTREIAHYQMFEAALNQIQPNFPPGIRQGDPRHSNTDYNMSSGADFKGPWNDGTSTQRGETWQYVAYPLAMVEQTNGLVDKEIEGTHRTLESMKEAETKLGKIRSEEIKSSIPDKDKQWSTYGAEKKDNGDKGTLL